MTRTTGRLNCEYSLLHACFFLFFLSRDSVFLVTIVYFAILSSLMQGPSANTIHRLFMHGGHTNHLADFSWNPNEPWLVASAAEDNLLQIWKVAEGIVSKDDGELPVDELDR